MTIDQFTVDHICAFVTGSDQTEDDRVAEYAQTYAQACEETNERLERCRLFLQSGHRTQALRFCDQEPPLKNQVEMLQLNGMVDLWEEAAATMGWQRFQPIKAEVMSLINDAYLVEDQVKDVLYQYRKMCLAKAPLSGRMLLLRQLFILDTTNPVWHSDILELEKSLMAQIVRDGNNALQLNEFDTLVELVEQADAQEWQAEETSELKAFLSQAVPVVYGQYKIPMLVKNYNRASKGNDIDEMRFLREQITGLFNIATSLKADFAVDQKVQQRFDNVNKLLDNFDNNKRRKAYNHDVQLLQALLDGSHTKEQVEIQLAKVESHGHPVHPNVYAIIQADEADEKDTKTLQVIAITSLIFLVLFFAVMAFFFWDMTNK